MFSTGRSSGRLVTRQIVWPRPDDNREIRDLTPL